MRKVILVILTNLALFSILKGQGKGKTILAIYPHADDETAIGMVLSKYSKENKIYVVYTVDNIDTSGLDLTPEGDSINHMKITEAKCACKKLGIEPVFLGFGRLDARRGLRAYFEKIKMLKSTLTEKISQLKPEAIITFGPDGESGHYEHKLVSSIVTDIILYNGWVDRYPLYYMSWPKEENHPEQLSGTGEVDKQYLSVAIHFSQADDSLAFESYKCYKSQFSPKDIKEREEEIAEDKSRIFYFRQFTVTTKKKTDLFAE